ncbi:DUF305 domain-containing protein [Streptomyces sp. NPDC093094]|uniref:DUF305 domain-containing protein n=1 Tax=Streptomyces sp. NPDC093094 TaxID=3366026 RepID=UPI0038131384
MSSTTRTLFRRAASGAAAVAAALVLAACGGDGTSGSHSASHSGSPSADSSAGREPAPAGASGGTHNAQDVSFAQGMVPHHRQALEMAGLAADRASSAEVRDLASRIEKAQGPEIETMSGWLDAWGEDAPASGTGHAGHSGTAGMTDHEEMTALAEASGRDFDTKFLSLMVEHHEGAVEMATAEKERGRYGPARTMAGEVVTAQSAEIEEMNRLLGAR